MLKTIWLGRVGRSGNQPSPVLPDPGLPNHDVPANDNLTHFELWHARTCFPLGNGRRVLWGCAEPLSYSLRLGPTAIEISLRPTYWGGRTHAKALGSVGGCAWTEIGCCSRAFGLRVPIHHQGMTMGSNCKRSKDANTVLQRSFSRAGCHCPKWARTRAMRRRFFRIYELAQYQRKVHHAKFHVDHIIPLHGENVSGLHVPWNLKVIRAEINLAKGTIIVDEWLPKVEEMPIDPDRMPWGGFFSVGNACV